MRILTIAVIAELALSSTVVAKPPLKSSEARFDVKKKRHPTQYPFCVGYISSTEYTASIQCSWFGAGRRICPFNWPLINTDGSQVLWQGDVPIQSGDSGKTELVQPGIQESAGAFTMPVASCHQ